MKKSMYLLHLTSMVGAIKLNDISLDSLSIEGFGPEGTEAEGYKEFTEANPDMDKRGWRS